MNQRQFCFKVLGDEFRARFGRELDFRAYVYTYILYGKAVVAAMGEGFVVRLWELGTFRPLGGKKKLRRTDVSHEGKVKNRFGNWVLPFETRKFKKDLQKDSVEVVKVEDMTYLCLDKAPERESRLKIKRYVSSSKSKPES